MEVIGHGGFINFRSTPLLCPQTAGKIAEVIDRQRQIGIQRFAHRFTIVPAFSNRQIFQVLLNPIGDLKQQVGTMLYRCFPPGFRGAVCGIKSKIDIFGIGAGKLCNVTPVHGGGIHKVFAAERFDKLTVNIVTVCGLE